MRKKTSQIKKIYCCNNCFYYCDADWHFSIFCRSTAIGGEKFAENNDE